ncbi:MAG: GGDEF domain-containing protein [Actinobacteria bacterium]|nr:GGDEF domain-containing protein [Actinomycetota bacterium]MCG2818471.1 GGDEF domain-containing protein [Actinomycetes bacterium]MBU4219433.1 GGDEF domain-containing protein [Actinomycetota bacterium]MBU4358177.1 GGDEF domain-containing protein [Actinomycetota bacterium]MBU4392238.1 GGDEF domain-containing protein [Actinomycetota bacterium]
MKKGSVKKLVQAFSDGLAEEEDAERWDSDTERVVETIYGGLLSCVDDELYVQEFLPFGSIYKLAGERAVRLRKRNVPIEKVMEEHILLRDVFWELRRSRIEKVHDFTVERRICQCFNSILQATVQAYRTRETTMDVLDPLRDQATGVFNSMYFMTRVEEEIKRSERYMRDVSVALFEIRSDFMEDSPEQTELIRAVARVLRRNSRGSDILARVEREKFGMLLPETRASDAVLAAERLKSQVTEYLAGIGGKYKDVSVGMGLASYPEHGEDRDVLMQEATESIMREVAEGE